MFDASYSRAGAETLQRLQVSALEADRAEREEKGITLQQQRAEERRLALERAAEEARTNAQEGTLSVETGEVQPATPPVDSDASGLHLRIGIFAVLVVVLVVLWIKQKKGS